MLIHFDASQGLQFKDGTAAGFEICGADQLFVAAQAKILPDGIVRVFSPEVPQPVTARYAWFNWGKVSLLNAAGLPAAPFTTKK